MDAHGFSPYRSHSAELSNIKSLEPSPRVNPSPTLHIALSRLTNVYTASETSRDLDRVSMAAAEEAPLGFAGDVDGFASFRITGNASRGFVAARAERVPPPPSLEVEGLHGGGVVLTGTERTVMTWRAQEELGLWLEERGLDKNLEGGGLHLGLEGVVNVGVIG